MLNNQVRKKQKQVRRTSCRRLNMWWMQGIRDGGCDCEPQSLIGVPRKYRRMYELGYIHGRLERKYACQTMGERAAA